MTRKISRTVFAMALGLGILAALSNPGHAALSTAARTDAVAAPAQIQAQAQTQVQAIETLAVTSTPAPAKLAAVTPVAATPAPVTTAAVATAEQSPKSIVRKPAPRRVAAAPRFNYPCH